MNWSGRWMTGWCNPGNYRQYAFALKKGIKIDPGISGGGKETGAREPGWGEPGFVYYYLLSKSLKYLSRYMRPTGLQKSSVPCLNEIFMHRSGADSGFSGGKRGKISRKREKNRNLLKYMAISKLINF